MADTSQENSRKLFLGIIFILILVLFMGIFIWFMSKNYPNVKKVAMSTVADSFATSVVNAHWQWRAEGQPNRIILVSYNRQGKETDRRPVTMSHLGWPRVEPNSIGCEKVWQAVLGIPLTLQGFKVQSEFYDGLDVSGKILDSYCKFSIAMGPYFEYKIYTGTVTKSDG